MKQAILIHIYQSDLEKAAAMQATPYPRVPCLPRNWAKPFDLLELPHSAMWTGSMRLLLFLIAVSIHLSKALFSQSNSSVLRLPSRNTTFTTGGIRTGIPLQKAPWPYLPFQRYIEDGLVLEVTAFGDALSDRHTSNILLTLLTLERAVLHAGRPDDVLEEIVTVGEVRGHVYTNIGFYSLHPPIGITVAQAGDVLQMAWQLLTEYEPPREITSSNVLYKEYEVALFRLSFRAS